eukprot:IDg11935t1
MEKLCFQGWQPETEDENGLEVVTLSSGVALNSKVGDEAVLVKLKCIAAGDPSDHTV